MQEEDTSDTAPNDSRLLTAKDVAERLQITEAWVHERARQGDIPCVPLGRYRRFRLCDIDEWIDSRATTANGRRS